MATTVSNTSGQEICKCAIVKFGLNPQATVGFSPIEGKKGYNLTIRSWGKHDIGFSLQLARCYSILNTLKNVSGERLSEFHKMYQLLSIDIAQDIDPYEEEKLVNRYYKLTFYNKTGKGLKGDERTHIEYVLQHAFLFTREEDEINGLFVVGAAETDTTGAFMGITLGIR